MDGGMLIVKRFRKIVHPVCSYILQQHHSKGTSVNLDFFQDTKKFWPTLNKDGLYEIVFSIIN